MKSAVLFLRMGLQGYSLRVLQASRISNHCKSASVRPCYRYRNQVRFTSTSQAVSAAPTSQKVVKTAGRLVRRVKNIFLGTGIGILLFFGYYYVTDTRATAHQWLVPPALRWIYKDAEEAHHAGTNLLKTLYGFGLHPRERESVDALGDLEVEVFGHMLANPVGISAGLDKGAEIPDPLFSIGPAVVEVGGVTPLPQIGNPKPRVFRLPSQQALINRYGLNSDGADAVARRLQLRLREYAYENGFGIDEIGEQMVLDGEAGVPPGSLAKGKLLAVQIAKNSATLDEDIEAVKADYVYCVKALAKYADILVVNISCPNVSGQKLEPLRDILTSVVDATKKLDRRTKPAVMVKVSPDEDTDEQLSSICEAVLESGIDGVIVSNTTKRRPSLLPIEYNLSSKEAVLMEEHGGYSGPQLFERTVALVKRYRTRLDDGLQASPDSFSPDQQIPKPRQPENLKGKVIFASGGITNARQVLEVLDAGASVAMLYTYLVYGGAGTITNIKRELGSEMRKIEEQDFVEKKHEASSVQPSAHVLDLCIRFLSYLSSDLLAIDCST